MLNTPIYLDELNNTKKLLPVNIAFNRRLLELMDFIDSFGLAYEEIGVFGSYARGEYKANSDIDICIVGAQPDRGVLADIRCGAEERKADVVFVSREYIENSDALMAKNIRRDFRRVLKCRE